MVTIRAFDLILTLRARPEFQLSADIHSHKAATKYLPYISTNLDLSFNQPLFVMRSRDEQISITLTQSGYGVLLENIKSDPKIACFGSIQKISKGQVCHYVTPVNVNIYIYIYIFFFSSSSVTDHCIQNLLPDPRGAGLKEAFQLSAFITA